MCFSGEGTLNTRNMYFQRGGAHITMDMCVLGRGTHMTRDMRFPGGLTYFTRDMCNNADISKVFIPTRKEIIFFQSFIIIYYGCQKS